MGSCHCLPVLPSILGAASTTFPICGAGTGSAFSLKSSLEEALSRSTSPIHPGDNPITFKPCKSPLTFSKAVAHRGN